MPVIRAFISPDEIEPGRKVTFEELSAIAATLNRGQALEFLAFLNLLLSSALVESSLTNKLEPVRDVQDWLFREVTSPRLLAALQARFRHASLLDRPILHRTQLLFAIRLVATFGVEEGGNMLTERDDFNAVGDLLFLTNGLFHVDDAGRNENTAVWVATQMGPLHETENPPELELAWPRIEDLLLRRLPETAADPNVLEKLERVAASNTGFSLRAWLDLTYLLFSFWSGPTFKELMNNRGRAYLDPNHQHEVVSRDVLLRAVTGLGLRFEDVPQRLRLAEFTRSALFDLTVFRTHPLWRMPDGRVLCVDVALLMERLGPHVFWSVMNALDTSAERHRFSSNWGSAFEHYCLDALEKVFGGRKWLYVRTPTDNSNNEELWDALATRDDCAMAFECKGTFVRSAEKYSGIGGNFFRGLSKKFGNVKHGGVYQLARGLRRQWVDHVAQPPVDLSRIKEVFPILLVQDPILAAGPVSRVLSDRFKAATTSVHSVKVWPLTVMLADDLDRIAASVEMTGSRLDAILRSFHRAHPSRIIPLSEFLSSEASAYFGFPKKVQAKIFERFKHSAEASIARFAGQEYGGGNDPNHAEGPLADNEAI